MVDIKLGVFEMVEQARTEIEEVDTVDAIEQGPPKIRSFL